MKIKGLKAEDVKIRILGDFAIIHARTSYTHGGRRADARPLHRLLGEAEREMARGVRARRAVKADANLDVVLAKAACKSAA